MMMFIMSCYGAGSMSKYDNRTLAEPEFCDDDVYNVMLLLRHNAGQEGRGEILLENSFLR